MASIEFMPQCQMREFAKFVTSRLDVDVVLRGNKICVQYDVEPPLICLPNMEYARQEDLEPIYGFCLHEAGHLSYSDLEMIEKIDDYLLKSIHNSIEDEYVERMLEREFSGARPMLERAMNEGLAAIWGRDDAGRVKTPIPSISFLEPGVTRGAITAALRAAGFPDEAMEVLDDERIGEAARRAEVDRAGKLWYVYKRRYNVGPRRWEEHPWRKAFDEATTPPACSTAECMEQARDVMRRIGVRPIASDHRPYEEARRMVDEVAAARRTRRDAEKALRELRDEVRARANAYARESLERTLLGEARKTREEACQRHRLAKAALAKARSRTLRAKKAETRTRERLIKDNQRLRDYVSATRKAEKAGNHEKAIMMDFRAECLRDRIREHKDRMARQRAAAHEYQDAEKPLVSDVASLALIKTDASMAYHDARQEMATRKTLSMERAEKEYATRRAEARRAMDDADELVQRSIDEADAILESLMRRDEIVEAHVEMGARDAVCEAAFEKYKDQDLSEELGSEVAEVEARKYCPYDRALDRVELVPSSSLARHRYDNAARLHHVIIRETTTRLSRLYSPKSDMLLTNVDSGRLNPRMAARAGLALRGVPGMDVSRIWRRVDVKRDPKVAVQMLLDCSGSMADCDMEENGIPKIAMARDAACALSEVMRGLSIPYEVTGHTTWIKGMDEMHCDEYDASGQSQFSRFVPFRGYVFKSFDDPIPAYSVFSHVQMEDNIDGEALLWAASRLARRQERTKLLIVISDGTPDAVTCNKMELERHLLTICRRIEAMEERGMFLFGIGIGKASRIQQFYRNADVYENASHLPRIVLGMVEHVLANMVGSLG